MAALQDRTTHVLEATVFDPVTNAGVTVRFCTFELTCADAPASPDPTPGMQIINYGSAIYDLGTGTVGGAPTTTEPGEIIVPVKKGLADDAARADDAIAFYAWRDTPFTVYEVAAGSNWAGKTTRIVGLLTSVSGGDEEMKFATASLNAKLEAKPLQPVKFIGRPHAIRFRGTGVVSSVEIGDYNDVTSSFTLEEWFCFNGSVSVSTGRLVAKGKKADSDGWGLYQTTTNTVNFYLRVAGATVIDLATGVIATGGYHLVSGVYDDTANAAYLYVDGVLVATATGVTTNPVNNANTLSYGGLAGDTNQTMNGDVLEVRIWNTARTLEEINRYYYGVISSETLPTGLIAWYKHDEISGTTAGDSASTPHNGTLTGQALTYYLNDAVATGSTHGKLHTAPASSTTGTGWTVGTVGSGNYSLMVWNTERGTGTFGGTALPSAAPVLTDCLRTESALTGYFPAANWSVAIAVRAATTGGAQDGRVRARIWKGAAADGSDAVEITSGAATGTTVTDLTAGATQTSTATCAGAGAWLVNEYVFVQLAWEITGAGGGAGYDVLLRANESTITPPNLLPAWVGTYEGESSLAGQEKPFGMGWLWHEEPVLIDSQKLIYQVNGRGGFHAGSTHVAYDNGAVIANDSPSTSTDLWHDPVDSGQVRWDDTRGLLRLGTAPAKLTVSVRALTPAATDVQEGYRQIESVVVESAGFSAGEVSITGATDWAGNDTVTPSGFYVQAGGVTCIEAVARICTGLFAFAGFEEDGIFRTKALHPSAISATAAFEYDSSTIADGTFQLLGVLPPVREVLAGWKPYGATFTSADIAGSLSAEQRADLQKPWRTVTMSRGKDRFGTLFSAYGDSARKITFNSPVRYAESVTDRLMPGFLDFFDHPLPVARFELRYREQKPKIGQTVLVTYPRYSFSAGLKSLVVGVYESLPNGAVTVDVVDVSTPASS